MCQTFPRSNLILTGEIHCHAKKKELRTIFLYVSKANNIQQSPQKAKHWISTHLLSPPNPELPRPKRSRKSAPAAASLGGKRVFGHVWTIPANQYIHIYIYIDTQRTARNNKKNKNNSRKKSNSSTNTTNNDKSHGKNHKTTTTTTTTTRTPAATTTTTTKQQQEQEQQQHHQQQQQQPLF